jgi:hypothetical protein
VSISVHRLAQLVTLSVVLIAASVSNAAAQSSPDKSGFTFLVNLGVGIQKDTALDETGKGLAGLNAGVGGFLKPNLAVLGRFSGTNVSYETPFGDVSQISGVFGGSLQYWTSDKVYVEGGVGVGLWSVEDESERGLGLILGAGYTIWNRGRHNLQVGVEYAPVFTDSKIHNFGFTVGYQMF